MSAVTTILILGSTGSIGTQALEVIRANRGAFTVAGIAAAGRDPPVSYTPLTLPTNLRGHSLCEGGLV